MVMMFLCDSWPAARASRKNRSRISGFGSIGARDDLDGDDALDQRIEGPVDDTHAALPELLVELIAANRLH